MSREEEEKGERETRHVAAFSEIVDSLNVKGGEEGGFGERSVFALDYARWMGGGSECLFRWLSEYGRAIVLKED